MSNQKQSPEMIILPERLQLIGYISEGRMICLAQEDIEGGSVIYLNAEDVEAVREALAELLRELLDE